MKISTISTRYVTSVAVGSAITFALLLVMHYAIHNEETEVPTYKPTTTLVMTVELKDQEPEIKEPEKLQLPDVEPEPPMPQPVFASDGAGAVPVKTVFTAPATGVNPTVGVADGDMLPIMTVPPEYPNRAASQGVEGWVIVEFTVDELGRVRSPRVLDAQPSRFFDRSALNAVSRYKYKPRVVNGQAVPVHGVRHRIVYNLSV